MYHLYRRTECDCTDFRLTGILFCARACPACNHLVWCSALLRFSAGCERSPCNLWTQLHRHPKYDTCFGWNYECWHAGLLSVLADPPAVHIFQTIPTPVVLLVQDRCYVACDLGPVHIRHGRNKRQYWSTPSHRDVGNKV